MTRNELECSCICEGCWGCLMGYAGSEHCGIKKNGCPFEDKK